MLLAWSQDPGVTVGCKRNFRFCYIKTINFSSLLNKFT